MRKTTFLTWYRHETMVNIEEGRQYMAVQRHRVGVSHRNCCNDDQKCRCDCTLSIAAHYYRSNVLIITYLFARPAEISSFCLSLPVRGIRTSLTSVVSQEGFLYYASRSETSHSILISELSLEPYHYCSRRKTDVSSAYPVYQADCAVLTPCLLLHELQSSDRYARFVQMEVSKT